MPKTNFPNMSVNPVTIINTPFSAQRNIGPVKIVQSVNPMPLQPNLYIPANPKALFLYGSARLPP